MADTHETIADIIAQMRFHGQQNIDAEKDKPEYGILTVEGEIALNYADRLEAAQRREKAEWVNANAGLAKLVDIDKLGNVAKLRDALKLYDRIFQDRTLIYDCDIVYGARTLARAALAAPPRNCDRFGGDNAKLQKVYYSERGKEYEPRDPISRQTYLVGYGNWLLAPATEKEGGAK